MNLLIARLDFKSKTCKARIANPHQQQESDYNSIRNEISIYNELLKLKIKNMKASISFLLLLLRLTLTNCKPNEKHAAKFTLEGAISGQDSGIIVLGYVSDSIVKYDTTRIVHGKFTFTGEIIEPTKAQLNGGNSLNNLPIYLEPGMMKIALVKDKFEVGKMTGSKAQLELDQLKELLRPLDIKFDLLRGQTDKIADSLKNATNDSIKHQLEKRTEEIDKQLSKIREDLNSTYLRFILDHPKSYVSSEYLEMLGANEIITLDSLKLIFNKLDITIQSSKLGNTLRMT